MYSYLNTVPSWPAVQCGKEKCTRNKWWFRCWSDQEWALWGCQFKGSVHGEDLPSWKVTLLQFIFNKFISKYLYTYSRLPGWAKAFIPANALKLEEKAWNAYPYCKTVLRVITPPFPTHHPPPPPSTFSSCTFPRLFPHSDRSAIAIFTPILLPLPHFI